MIYFLNYALHKWLSVKEGMFRKKSPIFMGLFCFIYLIEFRVKINLPYLWYCVNDRKAVILHSEIRDVHQLSADVYYFFMRGCLARCTQKSETYTSLQLTFTISSCEDALHVALRSQKQ